MELVQKLTTLGYALRGRVGEIDWRDFPCPPEICDLLPPDAVETHFFLEIQDREDWYILDPTLNKSFAQKHNLPFSEWGNPDNQSCFRITRLYDLDYQAEYAWAWLSDPDTIAAYIDKNGKFLNAISAWLKTENPL